MNGLSAIVLAAGLGTRMKSSLAKVLHPLAGRPMLLHTLENVLRLRPGRVVAVLGRQADRAARILPEGVMHAVQKEQLGTAHAAMVGLRKLGGGDGTLLLVSGDTPLLGPDTLRRLVAGHKKARADVTVLSAHMDDPAGYGRVIRAGDGRVERIVEQKDADAAERAVREVNTGTYCFDTKALKAALRKVKPVNAQKEYYLTDVVSIINGSGGKAACVAAGSPEEALGINSRADLAKAEATLRLRINERLMLSGVTIMDPACTYISAEAAIGRDTVIYPGNCITGDTVIGEGCVIHPGNVIGDSVLRDGVVVKGCSVINKAVIDKGAAIGPFAHIRPGSVVGEDARVGNFVELKKAALGARAKASHLSYLGDALIGRDVNVGAGAITCNYDGRNKYQTVIEDGVFVGSDTQFVAPVRVGRGAVVAAGTTVTEDVPADALAISRTPQVNKEGWARKKKK